LPSSLPSSLLDQQLVALMQDTEFPRVIKSTATEVMRIWNIPRSTAAGFVLSAVGEPKVLACIHQEWFSARANGSGTGLAKLIVRRRVFDLLRCDARRPHHESLPMTADEADGELRSLDDDPHTRAELNQIVALVRAALHGFAEQGPIQTRQAWLVRAYALDEVTCSVLADKLACSENALRVRIHKAMRALRRHIEACHPELEQLIGRTSARSPQPAPSPAAAADPRVGTRQEQLIGVEANPGQAARQCLIRELLGRKHHATLCDRVADRAPVAERTIETRGEQTRSFVGDRPRHRDDGIDLVAELAGVRSRGARIEHDQASVGCGRLDHHRQRTRRQDLGVAAVVL
jgi:DNA-directed RNA polymerase specialized sigma24 family protein